MIELICSSETSEHGRCGDGVNETPIASIWRCEGASPNPIVGAANVLILRSKVAFVHEGCLLVFASSRIKLLKRHDKTRRNFRPTGIVTVGGYF